MTARAAGRPGFLLGDATGLDKTLSVWSAIAAMPEAALSSASGRRSTRAKNNELAKHGTPKRSWPLAAGRWPLAAGRWPLAVFDESHRLRNPYAQQSLVCRQLADASTFKVYMSATAGQAPHELSYLGRLLGEAAGAPTETLAGFRDLMKGLGIGRAKGRWTNWSWEADARDCAVIADLL